MREVKGIECVPMNVSFGLLLVVGMVSVFLSACVPPEVEPVETVQTDRLVARVASVHLEEGYALIQRYGRLELSENDVLYTLSIDGKTSSLKASGEKLGQFMAVDIVSGELSIGDGVYLRNLDEVDDSDNKLSFNSPSS